MPVKHFVELLSLGEQKSLQTFVKLCTDQDLLQRPVSLLEEDLIAGLYDEATLLRFLRGRAFDANAALEQFKAALVMRQSVDAIASYEGVDVEEFEYARNMYPHWTGAQDKSGKPLCVFDLAGVRKSNLTKYHANRYIFQAANDSKVSAATRNAIVFNDYLTRFVLPVCSMAQEGGHPDAVTAGAVYLVDVSSLTLGHAWNLRLFAQDFSQLLATCYPEVVDKIYALHAPSYFGTIWALLSKWVDPRTAKKLVIVPTADTLAKLQETIDMEYIPIPFGGNFQFDHGSPPKLDFGRLGLSVLRSDWNGQLPAGPIKLARDDQGQVALVAVGTVNGVSRQVFIAKTNVRNDFLC